MDRLEFDDQELDRLICVLRCFTDGKGERMGFMYAI
jgi:hypothetical protein